MCLCISRNCLSFGIESKSLWYDGVTLINDIAFKGDIQGGQLSPFFYNVYTDDLNHHLQSKGVGRYVLGYVGGVWVDSPSYVEL